MKKNDNLFLKKRDFEINGLKNEIKEIKNSIDNIDNDIISIKNLYKNREKVEYDNAFLLLTKEIFLSDLIKKIEKLNKKREKLLAILNEKKEILKTLLNEKKAFEKYLKKKEKQKEIKEKENENRIANEIYTRKFFNH